MFPFLREPMTTARKPVAVGISEMVSSADPADVLVTYSLGSCAGLTLYDPGSGVGGLIHCMMPLSNLDKEKAAANPCMFVDTGIPVLLQVLYDSGAKRRNLVVKVAGCAAGFSGYDGKSIFRIGERNLAVVRKVLWKNDILLSAEAVGGSQPRTMFLYLESGRTVIQTDRRMTEI